MRNVGVRFIKAITKYKYLYLMLVPVLLWYFLFAFRPMYWLQIAFKDYNLYKGLSGSTWVGFKHFIAFFQGPYFWRLLTNTVIISLYGLVFVFTAPIILALMLNEVRNTAFKKTVQTITYLPYFISTVVVAGIVIAMLSPESGIVNLFLARLGFEKIYFLIKPEYFRGIYTTMHTWVETGFGTVVYMAALSGINQDLYEACIIDGGGRWKQTIHITLPGITSAVMTMLIMRIGSLLNVGYESIILLYQPVTYETADVINTYVFRMGIDKGNYAVTTAIGLMNSVIALLLVVSANKASNKLTQTGLW